MSGHKKAFDMNIRDMKQTAKDGQHRHGHQHATIEVGQSGLELVAKHIRHCPDRPDEIKDDTLLPLQFTMNNDMTGDATVICGWCKKELGQCTVKHIKDKK